MLPTSHLSPICCHVQQGSTWPSSGFIRWGFATQKAACQFCSFSPASLCFQLTKFWLCMEQKRSSGSFFFLQQQGREDLSGSQWHSNFLKRTAPTNCFDHCYPCSSRILHIYEHLGARPNALSDESIVLFCLVQPQKANAKCFRKS